MTPDHMNRAFDRIEAFAATYNKRGDEGIIDGATELRFLMESAGLDQDASRVLYERIAQLLTRSFSPKECTEEELEAIHGLMEPGLVFGAIAGALSQAFAFAEGETKRA